MLIVNELRNAAGGIFDLLARDIQRGRDHGLPDYNSMRAAFGLPVASSLADITSDEALQAKLEGVYGSIDRIDPIIGMLAEDHSPGASVGPLTIAVFNEQFRHLRDGDRFWYENDESFTPAEMEVIRATKLSDIIRRNTDIKNLTANVFVLPALGDFDADQQLTTQDIDLLCYDLGERERRRDAVRFDLTGDVQLDMDDLNLLLEIAESSPGDADLDGTVRFNDFLQLAAGFDEADLWSHGDFDCNHRVDFGDFLILATNFDTVAAVQASVPEPRASLLLALTLMGVAACRSRCRTQIGTRHKLGQDFQA